MAVFQSLANAHYGGAFYAVFRENCTDLPETCRKGHLWCKNGDAALGSLLFIRFQKKVQRDRCLQSKKKAHVARMSEVNAAVRVFRVQGSSFQEKMSLVLLSNVHEESDLVTLLYKYIYCERCARACSTNSVLL